MLFGLKGQIFQGPGGLRPAGRSADAVRAGELSHDQPATAQIPDEAAENGVGHARHGREHRRWSNGHTSDAQSGRKNLVHLSCNFILIWRNAGRSFIVQVNEQVTSMKIVQGAILVMVGALGAMFFAKLRSGSETP